MPKTLPALQPVAETRPGTGAPPTARLAPPRYLPRLGPAWPLGALLLLFPLWWISGLGTLIFVLVAVPMSVRLVRMGGRVRVPPGFGLWLLFLLACLLSLALLGVDPVGTLPGAAGGRMLGVAFSFAEYLAVTVIALFAYNLTREQLPQLTLVRGLGVMFLVTTAGGYLGLLAPTFQLTSPVELLLPTQIRSNLYVQSLVHPAAAQLMEVFGYPTPRPSAPFGYTNTWGQSLSLLLPWFVVGFVLARKGGARWMALVIAATAVVPVVYSLNRGLWVGLALSVVYVAVRSAAAGRLAAVGMIAVSAVLVAGLFVMTPLGNVLAQRLDHGGSNNIRVFTTERTLSVIEQSPLAGFGSTRAALGSAQSIAIGKSPDCKRCGNATLGSNGQIWANLMGQGLVGAFLYSAFFAYGVWRFQRDRTPIGYAGVLIMLLALVYQFFYNALVSPLCFMLLSYVLLARNEALAQRESSLRQPESHQVDA